MTFSTSPFARSRSAVAEGARPVRPLGGATDGRDRRTARLVEAAREIANRTASAAFTVQQVVEASGLSLKSFYRCFRGKDDLLVALLGADSRLGAEVLAEMIGDEQDPALRLRAFVQGIFSLATCPGAEGYAAVLVREHRRLSETHAEELDLALAPLVELLATEIARLGREDPRGDARLMFDLVIAGLHDLVMHRAEPGPAADRLWRFCWSGLGGGA